ncbi:MAG: hypothetical protein FWF56_06570 [Firmicutes bacterium]|nr:hypothetical protein [Bacillota bacterium]MCL1953590.1 hypothetical protein [Bacillota bacterium]
MKTTRLKVYQIIVLSLCLLISIALVGCNDKPSDDQPTAPAIDKIYGNWDITLLLDTPTVVKPQLRFQPNTNYVMANELTEEQGWSAFPYQKLDVDTYYMKIITIDGNILKDGDIIDFMVPNLILKINSSNQLEMITQTNMEEALEAVYKGESYTYHEGVMATGVRTGDFTATGQEPNIKQDFAKGKFENKQAGIVFDFDNNTLIATNIENDKQKAQLGFLVFEENNQTYISAYGVGTMGKIQYDQDTNTIEIEGAIFTPIN